MLVFSELRNYINKLFEITVNNVFCVRKYAFHNERNNLNKRNV